MLRVFKTISIGACVAIVFIAASAYQYVADRLDGAVPYDVALVAKQSCLLFIMALIVACSCISIGCNAK